MGPAAACAGTPPVANAGAACADVRAHRTRETAPSWGDADLSSGANPACLIPPDALVQRCFRVKARKIHFVSSSQEHFIRYCGKSPRWVLQQKQGRHGFPVGKHPGGQRRHHDHTAAPPKTCWAMISVRMWFRPRFVGDRYCVVTVQNDFSAVNPGRFIPYFLRGMLWPFTQRTMPA